MEPVSDFHATVGAIHQGRCPLCDGELAEDARCDRCDVAWRIQSVREPLPEGGSAFGTGPMVVSSRPLRPDEVGRLFDRGDA